jgi:hypothetical protein
MPTASHFETFVFDVKEEPKMNWYTGPVRHGSLTAFDDGINLVLSGVAITPGSGFHARATPLPINTYPPEFTVEVAPPDDSSHDSMTDAPFKNKFDRIPGIRSIIMYTADGSHLIPIHLTSSAASSVSADVSRATGYSPAFSFDEAFRNAVAQITADQTLP